MISALLEAVPFRERDFWRGYTRAIIGAGLAFALVRALQTLFTLVVFMARSSEDVDPGAFVILFVSAGMEAVVFVCVGWPLAYVPARVLHYLLIEKFNRSLPFFLASGVLLGAMFLPVAAALMSCLLPVPDGPSYLSRLMEYCAPMIIAGTGGGYAAWFSFGDRFAAAPRPDE